MVLMPVLQMPVLSPKLYTPSSAEQLDLRKLIGQGYDGPAAFAGKRSEVQKRIQNPLLKQSTSTVLVTGYTSL